ncbi:hypothetical protein EJB05_13144 [Eragrostis curvula]|uniref:Uncharacterized protein n=1 Tax=Eragrostis curvula TaxID=38414 RepID=A0A5J9VUX6_9POAL|nr:hypothetical protein EJB05_13144 [Eragrostis curvula]
MPSATNRSSSEGVVYPCVRRLRQRRLLDFLRVEGFEAAFGSMAGETDACFSVSHLQRLVERGEWKDAVVYLSRFLPPDQLDRLGLEAQVIRRFLVAHLALANIIAGTKEGEVLAAKYSVYRNHGSSVIHRIIRLRSIMLTALHAKQQLRTSMDWERVRRKASEIVNHLAYRTPELKGMLLMPSGQLNNVLPISFSPCRRRHWKKQSRKLRISTLAKNYLRKRRLPSHSQESHDEVLSKALNWVADIVDESLKAGKRPELHQEHPLQPSVMKGVTAAPISQPIFATLAGPAVNLGTLPTLNAELASSVSNAGHCKNSGMMMNNEGVTVAPVSQTMAAKTTGMPSVANAGLMSESPGSKTLFEDLRPAKSSGIALVTNSGATVAPVSHSVFGIVAGSAITPGMPSEANAGTNKHLSQDGCNAKSSHDGLDPRKNQGEVYYKLVYGHR